MSKAKIRSAKIVGTQTIVEVYKLKSGGWANYHDGGKTTYTDEQLQFID